MKTCRKCFEDKDLSKFYRHKQMFDSHLNICIECTKKRVSKHRKENIDKIREYDRERGKLPRRIKNTKETTSSRRKENKDYYFSHTKLGDALRGGKILKPKICSWCTEHHKQIEGHHHDYSKPLEVTWLCSPCHKKLHLGKCEESHKMRVEIGIPDEK